MMMAFGHCLTGWLTMMMLINWLALFSDAAPSPASLALAIIGLTLASALAMAGAAILSDWDHKDSTVTGAFGPFSLAVHKGIVELHYMACTWTADAGIRKPPSAHRGITHWWPFPLVIGGLTAWGCWANRWALFGVLFVLYTIAIRGLTLPDYMPRPGEDIRRRWTMMTAHGIIDLTGKNPVLGIGLSLGMGLFIGWITDWASGVMFAYWLIIVCLAIVFSCMYGLKRIRRYTTRTRRYGTYWHRFTIPVGKFTTAGIGAILALISIRSDYVVTHGAWVGALVCIGMYVHILGDSPTEMGIPGFRLTRFWRLPRWLAFRAGGPFEILICWPVFLGLNLYLLLGAIGYRPRGEILMVQTYVLWGLGTLVFGALIIEMASRLLRKRAWAR